MKTRFFICNHCGNLVQIINDAKVPLICCGEKMTELIPNTVEASGEKHIPVVSYKDDVVSVNVGSVDHPMVDEHFIQWVYVETEKGGQLKKLSSGDAPHVLFNVAGDKATAVYAYCNLHGLWKTEI